MSAQQLQQRHRAAKQRMLLQQRALQQQKHQQAMQNYESQFYQLLMTLNKKPRRVYNFVEDTDQTLKKYEQYRPELKRSTFRGTESSDSRSPRFFKAFNIKLNFQPPSR